MTEKQKAYIMLKHFIKFFFGVLFFIGILFFLYIRFVSATATLVNYWNLDENTGVTANDTADSKNCTLTGGATWATGKYNSGVVFGDDNDYLDCVDITALNSTQNFSIGLWAKQTNTSDAIFYIKEKSSTERVYIAGHAGGTIYFEVRNADSSYGGWNSNGTLTTNEWFHIVMVYDGTQSTNDAKLKVYINGSPITLSFSGTIPTSTPNLATYPLLFGYTASGWVGLVDDIHLYSTSMTAEEVSALYEPTPPIEPVPFDFTDSFDTYTVGTLTGQGGWLGGGTISTSQYQSSPKSCTSSQPYHSFDYSDNGQVSYYVYVDSNHSSLSVVQFTPLTHDNTIQFGTRLWWNDSYELDMYRNEEWQSDSSYTPNTWIHVQIAFQVNDGVFQMRYNIGDTFWSDWYDARYQDTPYISYILLTHGTGAYVDSINSEEIELICSERTEINDCIDNACYWYDSVCHSQMATCSDLVDYPDCQRNTCCWGFQGTCVACDTGLCSNGSDIGCANCNSYGLCHAKTSCFWTGTFCAFGTGVCSATELTFCGSGDCSGAGGFWYNNFCNKYPETLIEEPENPDFGIIGNAFYAVVKWAFVPDSVYLKNQVIAFADRTKWKFPFGYITAFANQFTTISSLDTGLPTLQVDVMGHTWTFLDLDLVVDTYPDQFALIYNLIKYFFYFIAGLYIYERVKNQTIGL
jgi:hypothetical protein